jgi:hypothetical protein
MTVESRDEVAASEVIRIVAATLIACEVALAGLVVWLRESKGLAAGPALGAGDPLHVVSWVAVGIAVVAVPLAFVLRAQIRRRLAEVAARPKTLLTVLLAVAVAVVPLLLLVRDQIGRYLATAPARHIAFLAFLTVLDSASILNLMMWLLPGPAATHPMAAGCLLAVQLWGCLQELRPSAASAA